MEILRAGLEESRSIERGKKNQNLKDVKCFGFYALVVPLLVLLELKN